MRNIRITAAIVAIAITGGLAPGTTTAFAEGRTCPKGEIKVTNEDGTVSCAKLTIVSPTGPGFVTFVGSGSLT